MWLEAPLLDNTSSESLQEDRRAIRMAVLLSTEETAGGGHHNTPFVGGGGLPVMRHSPSPAHLPGHHLQTGQVLRLRNGRKDENHRGEVYALVRDLVRDGVGGEVVLERDDPSRIVGRMLLHRQYGGSDTRQVPADSGPLMRT